MSSVPRFWGLAQRLGVLLALFGTLIASGTGYYAYLQGRNALLASTQAETLALAQSMVRRLEYVRVDVGRDLAMLATNSGVQEMLVNPTALRRQELQESLGALLMSHPTYLQLRLIASADFGAERVRVDRDPKGYVAVSGDDLEEKGHLPYVFEAQRLGAGELYLSRISINHEHGSHQAQGRPTAVFSMPVYGGNGVVVGVVVINADVQNVFDILRSELPPGYNLVLTNSEGDYLIHPIVEKAFGFDKGRRLRIQDDLPQIQAVIDGNERQLLVPQTSFAADGSSELAAFLAAPVRVRSGERSLTLGVTRPIQPVVEQARELLWGTLEVVAAVVGGCVVLGFMLSRWMVQPLEQIRRALVQFGHSGVLGAVPSDRSDELGELAQGVRTMARQISEQLALLNENRKELQHLAQHDMLTGLPNRRYLQDHLGMAVAQARRSHRSLALLFIDLDEFKEVNDRWGHDAGDGLLVELSRRLVSVTRESDTVARMGGDEFVVLVDSPPDRDHVAFMAQKLIVTLHEPVPWRGHSLQVGASIGISLFPQSGMTVQDLMANADRAMYSAKAAGRNTFVFFGE